MKVKTYRVTAFVLSCVGFGPLHAQHTLPQKEEEKSVSMSEVVVTGTGTEHVLKDAPVQTEVISSKMLRNFSGKSIEEILGSLTSSLAFNEDDMGSQMQLNGLGNNYILILIDGKRIHGDVGGENDLGLIDPQNIERIEIVKGASSALYGSDAIAGVINIITKKHDKEGIMVENTTRAGSYGDVRQHNGLALKYGKLSSYTRFQLQHSDGWQNTKVENVAYGDIPVYDTANKTANRHTNWQVAEHLTYTPMENLELYAEGNIYHKRIYRPCGSHPKYDVKTYDLSYDNSALAAGGKWTLNKTDYVSLDVDYNRHGYYYDYTKTTLIDGYDQHGKFTPYFPVFPGQRVLQSDQRRAMTTLKSVFTLPHGNRLSAGAEWRYDWLSAPMRIEGGRATDHTGAVYVQDEYNPFRILNVTAGLRLTVNEQFGARLTPKVSAMLACGPRVRLRASWSQGFKTPTLKEQRYYYVRQMTNMIITLGNHDLKPQTSNYYSLSAEYTWKGLSFSVSGYYNRLQNMITAVVIPNSQAPQELIVEYLEMGVKAMQYKNMENAKTYGVDLSARYQWKELAVGLNYSWLDTEANLYNSSHDRMEHVIIDGMAHHKGNFFATWNHAFSPVYKLGLGLYGRMSSKRYYQLNGNGKAYQIWRFTTSHDFGKSKKMDYRVEAGVDNIFNYVDRTPHGLHLGTTTPGTTVYASLVLRFATGKRVSTKIKTNLNQKHNEEN